MIELHPAGLAWFAAFGGKTDRRDSFNAILAMHLSDDIDAACRDGLAAIDPNGRAEAVRRILILLDEPDPWPES